jgi:tetraacyldisaccharide 4'-kinase
MKLKKPKFWDYKQTTLLSDLLYPLSILASFLSSSKNKGFKIKEITTICVGNIYVGGTGKTSLVIELKKILDKKKIRSCFIKKDYKDQKDEQKLLKKHGDLIIEKSRLNALKIALNKGYQIALFDDGLQDKTIDYDLKFVCFNKKNLFGNGRVIPAGPLREDLRNIQKYKNIFLIGNDEEIKDKTLSNFQNLNVFNASYVPQNLGEFTNKKYIAFSGIGNHHTFIDMLKKNNFDIIKDFEFPDHYDYSEKDLNKIVSLSKANQSDIITTEKDYLRLPEIFNDKIKSIKVKLKISNIAKLEKLLNEINL